MDESLACSSAATRSAGTPILARSCGIHSSCQHGRRGGVARPRRCAIMVAISTVLHSASVGVLRPQACVYTIPVTPSICDPNESRRSFTISCIALSKRGTASFSTSSIACRWPRLLAWFTMMRMFPLVLILSGSVHHSRAVAQAHLPKGRVQRDPNHLLGVGACAGARLQLHCRSVEAGRHLSDRCLPGACLPNIKHFNRLCACARRSRCDHLNCFTFLRADVVWGRMKELGEWFH